MDPIDLSDPELEKAATKIQATFKGYKVRKEITGKDAPGDAATEASSSAQQLEEEVRQNLCPFQRQKRINYPPEMS